ncbi:hypothetical protein B0H34DRAFT_178831 [Crassisporium funariophilum]|nr:hypothetical protein B0H34DRAFT_178831 [Crassisporium funariophilum]
MMGAVTVLLNAIAFFWGFGAFLLCIFRNKARSTILVFTVTISSFRRLAVLSSIKNAVLLTWDIWQDSSFTYVFVFISANICSPVTSSGNPLTSSMDLDRVVSLYSSSTRV